MRRRKSGPPDLGFTNSCGVGQVRGTPEGCTPCRSMRVFGGLCWWKDTCRHLLISGECRGRFSTTTRSWRWPRFWGRRAEEDAGCELQSHCLFKEKFGRPGKGNDKGKVKGWWAMRGGTLWCRFHGWA